MCADLQRPGPKAKPPSQTPHAPLCTRTRWGAVSSCLLVSPLFAAALPGCRGAGTRLGARCVRCRAQVGPARFGFGFGWSPPVCGLPAPRTRRPAPPPALPRSPALGVGCPDELEPNGGPGSSPCCYKMFGVLFSLSLRSGPSRREKNILSVGEQFKLAPTGYPNIIALSAY